MVGILVRKQSSYTHYRAGNSYFRDQHRKIESAVENYRYMYHLSVLIMINKRFRLNLTRISLQGQMVFHLSVNQSKGPFQLLFQWHIC